MLESGKRHVRFREVQRKKILTSIQQSLFLSFLVFALACGGQKETTAAKPVKVELGADVLETTGFIPIRNKRVGLLTHPAGINRYGRSTIDLLHKERSLQLVALFGPEHGIYGNAKADEPVQNLTDRKTGLPVYSLYGQFRRPTKEMLSGIDVLVIDLQDLGVRSYTYISAMRYALEECFRHGVEVVVLDRPNPLGGLKVDGPIMEKRWMSYVGAFRVPYVHGLTIGELARMSTRLENWLDLDAETIRKGKLTVIPMRGWQRWMMWPDTQLAWIPTSPAIPDLSAAMGYAMTGLGAQIGGFKHGYGTRYPFRLLTFPNRDAEAVKAALEVRRLPGLAYHIIRYRKSNGQADRGVYVKVTDWSRVRPTEISFYMMQLSCLWTNSNPFASTDDPKIQLFNKHVGSSTWWSAIEKEGAYVDVDAFIQQWAGRSRTFQQMSQKFWLYD